MNALMNITVRVTNVGEADLLALKKAIADLGISARTTQTGMSGFVGAINSGLSSLDEMGRRLQSVGRQLTYTFTIPLALATAAAVHFADQQLKSFAQLEVVYQGFNLGAAQTAHQLDQLNIAATLLSNTYGQSKTSILDTMTAYAKAGAQGAALAQDTLNTVQLVTMGAKDAATTTTGLIAIQQSYGASAQQMQGYVNDLIVAAQKSPIAIADYITAIQKAAGANVDAGVTFNQLVALIAGMGSATGNAAQAGTVLQVMMTRLLVPTKAAVQVLGEMGINVNSMAWQSQDGAQRLQTLADAFQHLTGAQQTVVASLLGSRFQISGFADLMRQMVDPTSEYTRVLKALGNQTEVTKNAHQELATILASPAQAFKILITQGENLLAQVVIPLVPDLQAIGSAIVGLVRDFTQLSPTMQQFILYGALFMAATGPVFQYIGSVTRLVSVLGQSIMWLLGLGVEQGFKPLAFLWDLISYPFQMVATGLTWIATGIWNLATAAASLVVGGLVSFFQMIGQAVISAGSFFISQGAALVAWVAEWGAADGVIVSDNEASTAIITATWIAGFAAIAAASAAAAASVTINWEAVQIALGMGIGSAVEEAVAGSAVIEATIVGEGEVVATGFMAWLGGLASGVIAWFTGLPAAIWGVLSGLPEVLAPIGETIVGIFASIPDGINQLIVGAVVVIGLLGLAIYNNFGNIQTYIANFANWLVDTMTSAFYALPKIVQNAITGVVQVLASTMGEVVNLLSYLNPFSHHSPSLVEQVQDGVQEIGQQYGELAGTNGVFQGAVDAHEQFLNATDTTSGTRGLNPATIAKTQKDLSGDAAALTAYNQEVEAMRALAAQMELVNADYAKQNEVVLGLKNALDASNVSVINATAQLKLLQSAAADTKSKLDAAKQSLSDLSNFNISGMQAMSDAIFNNAQAQKELNLQMLEMGQNTNISTLTTQLSNLQGIIEVLSGKATTLRDQGAGSDVLAPLTTAISGYRDQHQALLGGAQGITALQTQLAALQTQGQELALQNSLMFDPLVRQLNEAKTGMNELPFATLLTQTLAYKAQVDSLTTTYDAQNNAIAAQQSVVDNLTSAHGSLQAMYDIENGKLTDLKNTYVGLNTLLRQMQSDSASAATASRTKTGSLTQQAQDFMAGAGAPDPLAGLLNNKSSTSLDALIKDWESKMKTNFGSFDPFGPFKKAWNDAWAWVTGTVPSFVGNLAATVGTALASFFSGVWDWITKTFNMLSGPFVAGWNSAWTVIGPVLSAIGTAIQVVWGIVQPIFEGIWSFIKNYLVPIFQLLAAIVEIAFALIWAVIRMVINDVLIVLKGAWAFIHDVLGPVFMWLWQNEIKPAWDGISMVIRAAWRDIIQPDLQSLIDFFNSTLGPVFGWLWHNAIEPAFDGITKFFAGFWSQLKAAFVDGVNDVIKIFNGIADAVNWISGKLGLSIKVDHMPLLSTAAAVATSHGTTKGIGGLAGGGTVGAGFTTAGPRAIVGEGNPLYPEYVIPTDPTHRQNALSLYEALGTSLLAGGGFIPTIGNIVGDIGNIAGGALSLGGDVLTGNIGGVIDKLGSVAADVAIPTIKAVTDTAIKTIPIQFMRDIATSTETSVLNWMRDQLSGASSSGAAGQQVLGGGTSPSSHAIEDTIITVARSIGAPYKVLLSAMEAGLVESNMVDLPYGDRDSLGVFQQRPSQGWGTPAQILDVSYAAYQYLARAVGSPYVNSGTAGQLAQSVQRSGYPLRYDQRQTQATDILSSFGITGPGTGGFASGGVLPFGLYDAGGYLPTGLSLALNNTGKPEPVIPNGAGGTTLNFYGNLAFPNITNPADAEAFVRNLEALV